MAKLTKTEAAVLAEAERHPHGVVGCDYGVQAGRTFGNRRHNAICALRDKGMLVRLNSSSSPLYKPGWGQNGVVYTSTWQLVNRKDR